MSLTRLFEIAYTEAPQVDRDAGVIRGVKILGRASRNDREYSDRALRDAARFYEGLGVNLNHRGREQPAGERSVEDGLGWLQQVEVRPDGVYGDLHYFRAHSQAGLLVEAAERNPRRFGLSHHAEGHVERKAGKWVVESIAMVKSVDVVQNPATSNGLFESKDESAALTAKQILEAAPEPLALLAADAEIAPAAESCLVVEATGSVGADIDAAVQALAVDLLEDEQSDLLDRLRRAHRVLNAHHELSGGGAELSLPEAVSFGSAETSRQTNGSASNGIEQLVERVEQIERTTHCRRLLEAAERRCNPDRLDALVSLATDDERQRLIASWPDDTDRNPARLRPAISRPLRESRESPLRFPETTREFVAAMR